MLRSYMGKIITVSKAEEIGQLELAAWDFAWSWRRRCAILQSTRDARGPGRHCGWEVRS